MESMFAQQDVVFMYVGGGGVHAKGKVVFASKTVGRDVASTMREWFNYCSSSILRLKTCRVFSLNPHNLKYWGVRIVMEKRFLKSAAFVDGNRSDLGCIL